MITQEQNKTILSYLMPYNPLKVGIFGSYARNENKKDSDLDILVQFEQTITLLDIIGLEQDLSEQLGIKVDLVTEKALHPAIKKHIEKDIQFILND